jgi:murein DD-endopeptidase MepM/ murein hydrolase activator NlpD
LKNGYLIKIIPRRGNAIHRMEVGRRHLAALALVLTVGLGAGAGYYVSTLKGAEAQVRRLGEQSRSQDDALGTMDRQTRALGSELHRLQAENRNLRRLFGPDAPPVGGRAAKDTHPQPAAPAKASTISLQSPRYRAVASRLNRLTDASVRVRADENRLQRLAFRILNVRRLADLARAETIALIPSVNPVPGSSIASTFGWRVDPWPSFHKGLDLDADYGTVVHAAAAGTVVSAAYDGGFGLKVDIDHGNGYHTWYAHLSSADVHPGEHVVKTEAIARVGATGDATGPHLHYQIMRDGNPIDPAPYLTGVPPQVLASLK